MSLGITLPMPVLLSGLALPSFCKVGQPQAAQFVACPTTLPVIALRTCEHSAMHHAPWARMRAFSFSLFTRGKVKKGRAVGQSPELRGL